RWGIIARHGQPDHGAVGQGKLTLYQSFTKGPSPDYHTTIPILQSPGKNLAGRSGSFVDQHHQLAALQFTTFGGIHRVTGLILSFGIDDELGVVKEFVSYLIGSLQDTPSIIGKIKY